jgi:hypothetical protein
VRRRIADVSTGEEKKELMMRYLLGETREQEQIEVEDRYFHDPDFYLEMLAAEDELIRDYAHQRLSRRARGQFEQHFLASPRRRQKFETTRELIRLAESLPPLRVSSDTPTRNELSWFERLRLFPLVPQVAALAVLLLVLGGSVWLIVENARLREQLRQSAAEQAALIKQTEEQQRQLAAAQSQNSQPIQERNRPQPEPTTTQPPAAPAIVTLSLTGGLLRDPQSAPRLVIPSPAHTVRLRLYFTGPLYPSYRAELQTAAGEAVQSFSSVKARAISSGGEVVLQIPAAKFRKRDYLLSLSGLSTTGEAEIVGQYYFRAEK